MSGATYRIETDHLPADRLWTAKVYRMADDVLDQVEARPTETEALNAARDWIAAQHTKQLGCVIYVDDEGRDAMPVKA